MGRLHGGDDPQPGEARQIRVAQHLGVFAAVAGVTSAVDLGRPFVGIEDPAVAQIADGVNADLKAAGVGRQHPPFQLRIAHLRQTAAGRVVGEGFQEQGRPRSQGAVDEAFQNTETDPVPARRETLAQGIGGLQILCPLCERNGKAHPGGQLALLVQGFEQIGVVVEVLETGHTETAGQLETAQHSLVIPTALLGLVEREQGRDPQQIDGAFLEYAAGLAVGRTDDGAAGRVRSMFVDSGPGDDQGIDPDRMTVAAFQYHRVTWRNQIELATVRPGFVGEKLVIPTAALDQLPGWSLVHSLLEELLHLPDAAQVAQVQFEQTKAAHGEMQVGIVEAGNEQSFPGVDHPGTGRIDQGGGAGGVAGVDDPVPLDRQSLGARSGRVHGQHDGVDDDQVGRVMACIRFEKLRDNQ